MWIIDKAKDIWRGYMSGHVEVDTCTPRASIWTEQVWPSTVARMHSVCESGYDIHKFTEVGKCYAVMTEPDIEKRGTICTLKIFISDDDFWQLIEPAFPESSEELSCNRRFKA